MYISYVLYCTCTAFVANKHIHTHTHLTALFPGLPRWAGTRKVKPIWIFSEARDSEWQWHQLGHMQVCTSLQTENHASTPPLSFFTDRMSFLPPNQQRRSTGGSLWRMNFVVDDDCGCVQVPVRSACRGCRSWVTGAYLAASVSAATTTRERRECRWASTTSTLSSSLSAATTHVSQTASQHSLCVHVRQHCLSTPAQ